MFSVHSSYQEVITIINKGGVVVMPTDTIYGVVGSALQSETIERLYALRQRDPLKPVIILIGSLSQLKSFHVSLEPLVLPVLEQLWPGPTSVVLPCPHPELAYLHRGGRSLAFRFPKKPELLAMLAETGPVAAPSANPEGMAPATTIQKAQDYFNGRVDAYVDGGTLVGSASRIVQMHPDGSYDVIRP
ncbi:MAG TPA: L-threonylcarbamoyladenylate synthase [Candidatus Saccharimonadia bacterium]